MSPNIVGKKNTTDKKLNSNRFIKFKKDLKKLKKFVEENFEFVGDRFPKEVREIYYNNKKNKNIYGIASPKETKELEEEGIELASIPWIKNKEN